MIETIENPDSLQQPIEIERFREASQPLWDYLEQFHPHLWRRGETFPSSGPALRQLLDDGQVDIALSFNPADTSAAITSGLLPESTRTFVLKAGTIGNTHFVAIPYNASNREGALLVANFLLSPEAQAHKQNPEFGVMELCLISTSSLPHRKNCLMTCLVASPLFLLKNLVKLNQIHIPTGAFCLMRSGNGAVRTE